MNSKKKRGANWKLYCVLDRGVLGRRSAPKIAEKLYRAGADIIQLRYKNVPSYEIVGIAKEIVRLAKKYKSKLVIDDRVDVALATRANAVHLGKGDPDVRTARLLLGRRGFVGITVHSLKEARAANKTGPDYIGAGPVFPTPLKKHLGGRGVGFVRKVKSISRPPVFAIGGLNIKNMKKALDAGADGVCFARGIFGIK